MPFELIHTLVRVLLPFRAQFFFHMPIHTLFRRLYLPSSDPRSIHPALLNAIFLCAAFVAGFSSFEDLFLKRAQHHCHESLAFVNRPGDFLWASLLQGVWYCYSCRVLETRVAMSSTLKMAFAFGTYENLLEDPRYLLHGEMDAEEHTNLAHSLFLLDQFFDSGVGLPTSYPDAYPTDPRNWPQSSRFPSTLVCSPSLDFKIRVMSLRDGVIKFVHQAKGGVTHLLWEDFESLRFTLVEFQRSLPPFNDPRGLEAVEMPYMRFHAVTPTLLFVYMIMQASMILLCTAVATERNSLFNNVFEAAHEMASLVRLARGPQNKLPLVYCGIFALRPIWVGCNALVCEMKQNHPSSGPEKATRLNDARRDLNSLLDMMMDVIALFPAWAPAVEMVLSQLQRETPTLPEVLSSQALMPLASG